MKTYLKRTSATKIFMIFGCFLLFNSSFAQTPAKWSVAGNSVTSGDFLGTTNNEDLIIKTNGNTAVKVKANGNFILKSLEGSGNGLVLFDNNGKLSPLVFSGDPSQVLLGDGTFGAAPGFWTSGTSGKIYYNGGKVGIGTATPNFKLDVDGDVRITQNLYLQGELVISDKIQTPKQMKAGSIIVDSLLMDSTKAIYGVTNFKDDVKLANKLAVNGNATVNGSATVNGNLKLAGGLTFVTVPPVAVNPCFTLLTVGPDGTLAAVDATAELTFDPSTAPCGEAPVIPFTWQTYGNHVTSDTRWLGTIENFDFRIKTNSVQRMVFKKDGKIGIGTNTPVVEFQLDKGNMLITGLDNYLSSGNEATLYLGDQNHFIKAVNGAGVKIGTFGVTDGIFLQQSTGNVGIGTDLSSNIAGHRLSVNGSIHAKKVVIETGWSDFVFDKNYQLLSLAEVEAYIKKNGHLPNIPSATEVENNGGDLGELVKLQMQKIEELTLYVIRLEKELEKKQDK
jgi:hypothetical protein